jgi:SprT-like family
VPPLPRRNCRLTPFTLCWIIRQDGSIVKSLAVGTGTRNRGGSHIGLSERLKSAVDGKQLRALFFDFNERYWGGRLPAYHIRCVDHITWLEESGFCNRQRKLIRINRCLLDDAGAVSCLLHEMAHAATRNNHGMKWKAEMIRLREAGAPLVCPDSTIALDDWSGEHVPKSDFQAVIGDALIDDPAINLSKAVRRFIRSRGGEFTVSAFLRKYPWVRRAFSELKRESRERAKRRSAFRAKVAAAKEEKG